MSIYEVNQSIVKNAKEVAKESGLELISIRKFDSNPLNEYLKFVLCKRGENDYCTHLYNTSRGGTDKGFFVEGHYDLKSEEDALRDFHNRR